MIHKEGRDTLILLFVIFITIGYFLYSGAPLIFYLFTIVAVVFYALILWFFRVPNRPVVDTTTLDVIAPADGKVVVIEETEESEFLKEKCIQISIFMSPLNVHINWSPVSGKVVYKKHHPGKYMVAWHPKSSLENERTTTVISSSRYNILMRQIAGAVARRICNYTEQEKSFKAGEEMGFIKFGSRVDVFLPLGSEVKVKLEEKVKGSQTLLAKLPE